MRIAFQQVAFAYRFENERKRALAAADWALQDITFTIEDGEFLGIAGATGSGKSTLMRHLNGLVRPTRGSVTVDGEDLTDKRVARQARRRVGMVFQYPEHQLFGATVYEDVAFGPRNNGVGEEETDRRVRRALERVGLSFEEVAKRNPFGLSGGQKRRVAIAGVLACEPEVLALDEPAAGLDPRARNEMLAMVRHLHEQGLGIVMISHSMDELAKTADRILVLKSGRMAALGTPAEIFSESKRACDLNLALPATQALAERLRSCGFNLPESVFDETALAKAIAANLK